MLEAMRANLAVVADLYRLVQDSWVNDVTGLGTEAADKTVSGRFTASARRNWDYWAELFRGDALAGRICKAEPNEMWRKGFDFVPGEGNDAGLEAKVKDKLKELGAVTAMRDAMVWENVFGGGVVLLKINDGSADLSKPLNEANILSFAGCAALEAPRLSAASWYPSTHRKAGQVEVWRIHSWDGDNHLNALVHESRMLVFGGGLVTIDQRRMNDGWGSALLESVYEPLRDYNLSWRGATVMLQSASQDVVYFAGLKKHLSSATELMLEYFRSRWQTAQMRLGPNRALTLDADGNEKFERHSAQFSGVDSTLEQQAQRLCAATGIPFTLLFGRSPAGMNATGESDLENWYNNVDSRREERLVPHMNRLVRLILAAKDGPLQGERIDGWAVTFPALHQLSELEQADLRNKQANTDAIYIDRQVITPEEVAVSRFPADGWSPQTVIDIEARELAQGTDSEPGDGSAPTPAQLTGADPTPVTEPSAADPTAAPGADDVQSTALNGAQVQALQGIVTAAANGQLPRESALALIRVSFPTVTQQQAEEVLGSIGRGFKPAADPKPGSESSSSSEPPASPSADG